MRGHQGVTGPKVGNKRVVSAKEKGLLNSGSPRPGAAGSTGSLSAGGAGPLAECCECRLVIGDEVSALMCDRCGLAESWICADCIGLTATGYKAVLACKRLKFLCTKCDIVVLRSDEDRAGRGKMAEMMVAIEQILARLGEGTGSQGRGPEEVGASRVEECLKRMEERLDRIEKLALPTGGGERIGTVDTRKGAWGVGGRTDEGLGAVSIDEAGERTTAETKKGVKEGVSAQEEFEAEDRLRRKTCLIIHGLAESESDEPLVRKAEDLEKVGALFEVMGCRVPNVEQAIRLGKRCTETNEEGVAKVRPIKIVADSEESKTRILQSAKNWRAERGGEWGRVVIHQDMTPRERRERRGVVEELRKRRADGEQNLVMFRGGIVVRR